MSFRDWVRSWLGVTDDGVQGPQGEPGPVGPEGPQGEVGPQGEPGGTVDDAALAERVAWLEANAVTYSGRPRDWTDSR